MSNFNKTLNAFAERLSKFHISNFGTTRKGVKKAKHSNYLSRNTARQRGRTVKSKKHTAIEKRRRNAHATAMRQRKTAATAKARATRAERKEAEEQKAKTLVVEGRTRAQAKSLAKNSEMK
jgi:hypothetical protein